MNPSSFPASSVLVVIVDNAGNRTGEVRIDNVYSEALGETVSEYIATRYNNALGKRDQDRFSDYLDAVRFAGGKSVQL